MSPASGVCASVAHKVPSVVVTHWERLDSQDSAGTSRCHRSHESGFLDSLVCHLPTATSRPGEVGCRAPCEASRGAVSRGGGGATRPRYPHHPDRWALSRGTPVSPPGGSQDDLPASPGRAASPWVPPCPHTHPDPGDPRAARRGLAPHPGLGASSGAFRAQPHDVEPLGAASARPRPEWGRPGVRARGRCGPLAHKGGGGKEGRGGPGAGAAGRGGGGAGGDKAPAAAAAQLALWDCRAARAARRVQAQPPLRLPDLPRRRRSPSSDSPPRRHPAPSPVPAPAAQLSAAATWGSRTRGGEYGLRAPRPIAGAGGREGRGRRAPLRRPRSRGSRAARSATLRPAGRMRCVPG